MENSYEHDENEYKDEDSNIESGHSDDEEVEASDSEREDDTEDDKSSNSETPDTDDPADNLAYQEWYDEAMTATEELRNEKYDKYISKGMSDEEAKEKAHVKVLWAVKRIFFHRYSNFLRQSLYLGEDDTNQDIISDLSENVENGMNVRKAVQRVLARQGTKFDGLFHYQADEDDDDDNDDDDDDDDDDEM